MLKQFSSWRSKTPTVLQMEATECGAATLAIILAYYGRHVPLEEMRLQCGVSRDGSKAINIIKAARYYGLSASAVKIEDIDTFSELDQPCIIFWEFDHFVVVEGMRKNKIYINDPATGPRFVGRAQFSKSFTGVAILLEPKQDFEKGGVAPNWFNSLQKRLQNSGLSVLFVVLASLSLVITGFLTAAFGKIFIDDILIGGHKNWLLPLITGMVITALIRGALTWLQSYYLLRLQVKLMVASSAKFFLHVLTLPITFFQQRYAGDVTERIESNMDIAELLSNGVSENAVNIIAMVFFGLILILLSWPLAIVTIAVAMINAGLLLILARKIADKSRQQLQDEGKLSGIEMNGITIIETLKSTGMRSDFFTRWAGTHAKTINSQQSIMLYSGYINVASDLLLSLLSVVIIGLGCWLITQGQLTVGGLVAFQSISMSFQGPISELLDLGEQVQQIKGDLTRLDDVLENPQDPQLTHSKDSEDVLITPEASLEFREISFGYSILDEPYIENFSWMVPKGGRVAIVGSSGSGKSTLAKLASGLVQPWQGEILLDDKPIKRLPQNVLALALATVDQEITLFSGTIRDNLTLWNNHIADKNLYQALSDACILEDVLQRGGLNTLVEENGLNFSGGQRQRLEIARALIQNPSFLILDEATAALDPIVEKDIYLNLKQRQCTLLIIAHRLSTVRDCDEIIVLEMGDVVQHGTHDRLFAQPGVYRELVLGEVDDE